MGLLERIDARRRGDQQRSSIDTWIDDFLIPSGGGSFTYGGQTYPLGQALGLNQTLAGTRVMEVANSLPGYTAALRRCPPAFAAQMVRALILSQARFTFRSRPWSAQGKRTFGTGALSILEKPWPKATTGELLAMMEWHAGLTGNAYVHRRGARLRVLRPDWVGVIWGSELEPDSDTPGHALDGELLGYAYWNGGLWSAMPSLILPDEAAHWSPIPDPESPGMGMSWLTPAIRDMQSDRIMTDHKVKYFENGAAQPYNSEVLTPSGWVRMEDVAVGDEVTGPDGKPRRILGIYPQGEKDIYRLTFSGGATVECCEDHLWQVATVADRKSGTHRVMSLREILDRGVSYPSGPAKWSVPLVDPVEYAAPAPLPLDPYLLGCLLGDGSFRGNGKGSGGVSLAVGAADADETEARVRQLLPLGVTITRRDRAHTNCSELYFKGPGGPWENPLTRIVRDLGLFDVPGRDKTVPEQYMRGLVADRIALLQGLIDTDGHVNRSKHGNTGVTFSSTSEVLAEQVRELVLSLGGTARCRPAGDRPGQPNRNPQWRVYLNRLPDWITPVRLARKRADYKPVGRGGRYQYLRSVELVGRKLAQCIKVDADDGLYVTDDFVVTHNSPNLVIKGLTAATQKQFNALVDMLEERHTGAANAYRTLYLTGGADATVVGSNLGDMDFKAVQGASETRISFLSRVPAPILGIAEGLAGSSLNAGNFGQARRNFADGWVMPTLQNVANALAPLVSVPSDAELWPDTSDIGFLREDAKDAAEIEDVKARSIRTLVDGGFEPASVVAAVTRQDMTLLKHSGLTSVQLLPPGSSKAAANGAAPPA